MITITEKIKNIFKNKILTILLFGIFVGLIFITQSDKKNEETLKQTNYTEYIEEYTNKTENKLCDLINKIDGASDAKVMITLKSGTEFIYASDGSEISEKHVIVDNDLVYVKENLPLIEGVAVVCRGGNNPATQAKITDMICSLLGLYSTHVYVTE